MALHIPTRPAEPCWLEECLSAFDAAGFDPDDARSVADAAQWLARLAANREFLGDIAMEQLKQGCRRGSGQGYTPQVIMLGAARRGWFMRANIWPSAQESVLRDSGEAAFVYGLPHDHNFHFLTVGYHGPGYRSDHYEVDPDKIVGIIGEQVDLRFIERSTLDPGKVMHYRARRDVHCQFAPESLSVSINLMHSAARQRWQDQFQYDLQHATIAKVLTGCTADTLARLALALDPGNGRDVLETIAARHPLQRLRWAAIGALADHEAANRSDYLARQARNATGWLPARCMAAIGD